MTHMCIGRVKVACHFPFWERKFYVIFTLRTREPKFQGTKVPWNESSGAKVPGNESSTHGTFAPGSESTWVGTKVPVTESPCRLVEFIRKLYTSYEFAGKGC